MKLLETKNSDLSQELKQMTCNIKREIQKQAQAGNSMRYLRDIRRGVTDGQTEGRTVPFIEMR